MILNGLFYLDSDPLSVEYRKQGNEIIRLQKIVNAHDALVARVAELEAACEACLSYMIDSESSDVTGSIALAKIRAALARKVT